MEKKTPRIMSGWPSNKKIYDQNYEKIFPPCICGGKGYHWDWCSLQKKYIKTTCILCSGTGVRLK